MKIILRIFMVCALFPLLFLSQSCDKIEDEINKAAKFDHEFDLPAHSFTVDSAEFKSSDEIQEWKSMTTYEVSINLQKVLEDNDLSSATFTDGSFTSFTVSIVLPTGANFDFVQQMRVLVSMSPDFNPSTEVGSTDVISPGSSSVTFNIPDVDVTPYLEATTFYVVLEGYKLSSLPTFSIDCEMNGMGVITVEPL